MFPLSEAEAYVYICHLRREGAPKSRLAGFFQAVGFSKGLLGAEVDAVLSSPRVKGACSNTEPHVVAKKSPLSVEEVVLIERMAFQSRGQDGIIAGFVCFVLHSRLRWTDAMHVDAEPVLDVADGHGYLESSVYSHKTAAAFKWQVLPVVSVLPGVSGLVWAEPWLQNRQAHGLRACKAVPFQPAPLAWGGWAAVPFDACHGAIWLREKLSAFRTDPKASMALATHSLKATVLSWLSKAACPSDLQRRAGYHVSASEKNPLEYERDGQAGVLHFIHVVSRLHCSSRIIAGVAGGRGAALWSRACLCCALHCRVGRPTTPLIVSLGTRAMQVRFQRTELQKRMRSWPSLRFRRWMAM